MLVSGPQHTPISASGDGTFGNATGTLRLRFDDERLVITVLGDVPDTLIRTQRVTSIPREQLTDYVGAYVSPEIATPYEVVTRDSTLFLRISHGDDIPLSAAFVDGFSVATLPTVRFLRDASGRVIAMSFTGRGIHDLRLRRQ
jgi:hypothetical protein